MSKRAFLAFFLSLLVLVGYNYLVGQKYPPAQLPPAEVSEQLASAPSSSEIPEQPQQQFLPSTVAGAQDIVVETDLMRLVLTTSGARIKSCQLKGYAEERLTLSDIELQISKLEQSLISATPEKQQALSHQRAKLEALRSRIMTQPTMAELVALSALANADYPLTILYTDKNVSDKNVTPDKNVNLALNTALYTSNRQNLVLTEANPTGSIELVYRDAQGRGLKKVFTFSNSNYSIGLSLTVSDGGQAPSNSLLLYYGPDLGMPQAQSGRRTYGYEGPVSSWQAGQQSWVLKEKYTRNEQQVFVRREHQQAGELLWTGLQNKYFLAALIPAQPAESVIVEKNKFGEHKVALSTPLQGPGPYNFRLYLGPKKEDRLKEIGVSLDRAIDYGFFSPIARFIFSALLFFSRWTHNFGWAIVLLCLAIKVVFYPLTHHSFESMQKMQQQMKTVQPEMDALREKNRDNPQKLNKEMMELYRKRGVNPLASCQSGCLPLLLQMPVFFALYAVLYNSIELRGAPFFGWVQDLSAKDPYYVLPILMGISMFVQQKLTGMGAAGGAQQEQAKMMAVIFPVMLTFIFASLPSGVVLYWFTFNLFTALQQLIIKRKQAAAAV